MRYATGFVKEHLDSNLIVAEIGVLNGRNAKEMLDNLDIKRLYLVDPYQEYVVEDGTVIPQSSLNGHRKKMEVLLQGNVKVEIIIAPSIDAAVKLQDVQFDFVYIDGNHSHPFVDCDIAAWYPLVKSGGVIAGHDFNMDDVHEAVTQFAQHEGLDIICGQFDWVIWKGQL